MLLLIGFTCGAVFTTGIWMLVTAPEKYFGKVKRKKKTGRNEAAVSSGSVICQKQMSSSKIVAQVTISVKED